MPMNVTEWLLLHSGRGIHWYLKRLSGNDTLATGARQAGLCLPKQFLFGLFPALSRPEVLNPDTWFDLYIDSHDDHRRVRAVWYNSKFHSGNRNETKMREQRGRVSALLDSESTGALAVFAFSEAASEREPVCHAWVCPNVSDEDLIENWTGPIEPGRGIVWIPHPDTVSNYANAKKRRGCRLDSHENALDGITTGVI